MFRLSGIRFPPDDLLAEEMRQPVLRKAIATGRACRRQMSSWGEPFAEMFYEAIRYFRGLAATGNATTQFYQQPDNGIRDCHGSRRRHVCVNHVSIESKGYGDPYITRR